MENPQHEAEHGPGRCHGQPRLHHPQVALQAGAMEGADGGEGLADEAAVLEAEKKGGVVVEGVARVDGRH